ncbi:DEAD/DEAH box helicase, partial [Acinetobacter baumannii]
LYTYWDKHSRLGQIQELALPERKNTFAICYQDKSTYTLKSLSTNLLFKATLKRNQGILKVEKNLLIPLFEFITTSSAININAINENGERLRAAQIGALYSLIAHWTLSKEPATVVLPTGTGKTETMLLTTLVDQSKRTLVIVPTIELKEQLFQKFSSWGILKDLGVIPQNFRNPKIIALKETIKSEEEVEYLLNAEVIISTPALLARSPSAIKHKLKNFFSHVYFDEAHHVTAKEWDMLKQLFSASKIVQFTATPYRLDRHPIQGKVVYNYPLSQALNDKCFSKISLISVDERHPSKKDYEIAHTAINQLYKDRQRGFYNHKVMVRAETREKAEDLLSKYRMWFPEEKITLVHSKVSGKKQIIESIKNHEFDIVICVDMLKEGFDYPNFKIAAVHGMHKSISVLLQFIGRFTRTKDNLGDASFIVNFAEEKLTMELESLFQEGTGWENVISQIADTRKEQAASLLAFLQECKPLSGFDSPDIDLNPKIVFPALSFVCFHAQKVDWYKFREAFNTKYYSLSQPFINEVENVFYFTTQCRDKVKWAKSDHIKDQIWGLVVLHFDKSKKLLYLGYSDKLLDIDNLVQIISLGTAKKIDKDDVFKSFNDIKRLSIVHAGVFKPANHLHRYSRFSGADVTIELSKIREGSKCKKSDFVGIGYRNGKPISIGASAKGKIWSPAKIADLKEWKEWCIQIGALITDPNINSDQILEDSAKKQDIVEFPENIKILAADWAEELYEKIHRITLKTDQHEYCLYETKLIIKNVSSKKIDLAIKTEIETLDFSIELTGGENGFNIQNLDNEKICISNLKREDISLKKFFENYPPTLFLSNSDTISGCIHTIYNTQPTYRIPSDQIHILDWENVHFPHESMYKNGVIRENSVQEYIMKKFVNENADIVFNDDNSGEVADVVAIYSTEEEIIFKVTHCKYSKQESGSRLSDLYEVCGQVIVSLRYKWKPEDLISHLKRRNKTGVLAGKRFYKGNEAILNTIRDELKYKNVRFLFSIAQPGVSYSALNNEMTDLLSSTYSAVVDMTETKLLCYFNS